MDEELWDQLLLSTYSYAHGDNVLAARLLERFKSYNAKTFPRGEFRMWLHDMKEVLDYTEKLGILPLERPEQ